MSAGMKIGIGVYSIDLIATFLIIVLLLVKGKKTLSLYWYLICYILMFVWLLFGVFKPFVKTMDEYKIPTYITFLPVCIMGITWMTFCFYYTNSFCKKARIFTYVNYIIVLLVYISILTSDYNDFYIKRLVINGPNEYGFLFLISVLQNYIGLALGIILLIVYSLKNSSKIDGATVLIVSATLVPFFINFITTSRIIEFDWFDLTPASFSVSLILSYISIFKYRFLDIMSFAYKEISSNMKDAMLIIDDCNRIMEYNNSFGSLFQEMAKINKNVLIKGFIGDLLPFIVKTSDTDRIISAIVNNSVESIYGELCLLINEERYFNVYIKPIFSQKNTIVGRVIILCEITQYKKLILQYENKNEEILAMNVGLTNMNQKLQSMNQELVAINEQLKNYSHTVGELAAIKERNRFTRDIHDTLGHTMTLLITLMEVGNALSETKPQSVKEKINEALKVSKAGIKELNRLISGIEHKDLKKEDLQSLICSLIADVEYSGVDIDFFTSGMDNYTSTELNEAIFRICQESLTNSLRHGKSKKVTIRIIQEIDNIKIMVFDYGTGCKDIIKGYGLLGMEERVKSLQGSIEYSSSNDNGFCISVEIPIGGRCKSDKGYSG